MRVDEHHENGGQKKLDHDKNAADGARCDRGAIETPTVEEGVNRRRVHAVDDETGQPYRNHGESNEPVGVQARIFEREHDCNVPLARQRQQVDGGRGEESPEEEVGHPDVADEVVPRGIREGVRNGDVAAQNEHQRPEAVQDGLVEDKCICQRVHELNLVDHRANNTIPEDPQEADDCFNNTEDEEWLGHVQV